MRADVVVPWPAAVWRVSGVPCDRQLPGAVDRAWARRRGLVRWAGSGTVGGTAYLHRVSTDSSRPAGASRRAGRCFARAYSVRSLRVVLGGVLLLVAAAVVGRMLVAAGLPRHGVAVGVLGLLAVVMAAAAGWAGFGRRDLTAGLAAYLWFDLFAITLAAGAGGRSAVEPVQTYIVLGLIGYTAAVGWWWVGHEPVKVNLPLTAWEKLVRFVLTVPLSYLAGSAPAGLPKASLWAVALLLGCAGLSRGIGYAAVRLTSTEESAERAITTFTVLLGLVIAGRHWYGRNVDPLTSLAVDVVLLLAAVGLVTGPGWLLRRWPGLDGGRQPTATRIPSE